MRSRHSLQNNGRPVLCCQAFLWSYTLGAFVANNDAGLLSEYAEKLRRIGRSLGKCEYQEHIWHHLRLIKGVMKNPKAIEAYERYTVQAPLRKRAFKNDSFPLIFQTPPPDGCDKPAGMEGLIDRGHYDRLVAANPGFGKMGREDVGDMFEAVGTQ